MSKKSLGKDLQRMAEDELKVRPSLQGCHNIMRDATWNPVHSREEHVASVFLANRERLIASAERKTREEM